MTHFRLPFILTASLCALILGACSSAPSVLPAGKQQFHVDFGDGLSLDYAIERKISSLNGKACYAFITGNLNNKANRTVSRRSVIDFIVNENGKMLFRDITNPVSDIPAGGSAMFEMVDSPVHKDGCPNYDRINVSLRKVFAD